MSMRPFIILVKFSRSQERGVIPVVYCNQWKLQGDDGFKLGF